MRSADLIAAVLASKPDDWVPHPKEAIDPEPTDDCEWPNKVEREPVDGKPSYFAEALVLRADHKVMIGVGRLPPGPPPKIYTREPWAREADFESATECEVQLTVKDDVVTRWQFVWTKEHRQLLPLPMLDGDGGYWVAAANARFAETLFKLLRPTWAETWKVADLLRAAKVRVREAGKKTGK